MKFLFLFLFLTVLKSQQPFLFIDVVAAVVENNIVFGPKVPQGIILPELLTKNTVLSALKKAKKH